MSFEELPPATLEEARKIVEFLLHRNEELTEQAALLAAGVGTNRLYLERALEGIKNTPPLPQAGEGGGEGESLEEDDD